MEERKIRACKVWNVTGSNTVLFTICISTIYPSTDIPHQSGVGIAGPVVSWPKKHARETPIAWLESTNLDHNNYKMIKILNYRNNDRNTDKNTTKSQQN